MLRSIESILGYIILATDGNIGGVHDFYFDDESWTIRYLVVDTGTWFPGQKVLISTGALGQPNWETKQFPVALTKEQIKNCPDVDISKPISRQQEAELHSYYDWPPYWSPKGLVTPRHLQTVGGGPTEMSPKLEQEMETLDPQPYKPGVRSIKEVTGYHIQATDGEIGHVEDFIIEDDYWMIRYMVIDTRNWLPGRKVLISPGWIKDVSWAEGKVSVMMTQENIKHSPEYDPGTAVNREYEVRLYDYYGRPYYWSPK